MYLEKGRLEDNLNEQVRGDDGELSPICFLINDILELVMSIMAAILYYANLMAALQYFQSSQDLKKC